MSVGRIFGYILATIAFLVFAPLVIEYLNLTASSVFMTGILRQSVQNACNYFAQETYKRPTGINTGDAYPIKAADGTSVLSGNFYGSGNEQDIYNELYGSGSPFRYWFNGATASSGSHAIIYESTEMNKWKNLNMVAAARGDSLGTATNVSSIEKSIGKQYIDDMMTPLNLGIPYMDATVLEKIAKWNLVATLSEGKSQNIQTQNTYKNRTENGIGTNGIAVKDDKAVDIKDNGSTSVTAGNNTYTGFQLSGEGNDEWFVQYKGYRVYFNEFKVNHIYYLVYDLGTSDGKLVGAKPAGLGDSRYDSLKNLFDQDMVKRLYKNIGKNSSDERKYFCIAVVDYSVPMFYYGITNLYRTISYASSFDVNGFTNNASDQAPSEDNSEMQDHGNTMDEFTSKNSGATPFNNRVMYYITR